MEVSGGDGFADDGYGRILTRYYFYFFDLVIFRNEGYIDLFICGKIHLLYQLAVAQVLISQGVNAGSEFQFVIALFIGKGTICSAKLINRGKRQGHTLCIGYSSLYLALCLQTTQSQSKK